MKEATDIVRGMVEAAERLQSQRPVLVQLLVSEGTRQWILQQVKPGPDGQSKLLRGIQIVSHPAVPDKDSEGNTMGLAQFSDGSIQKMSLAELVDNFPRR